MAAIAVVVDGGDDGIDSKAPMAVSLTIGAVDGGGNDGVFTTRYNNNYCHTHPHRPRPCPLLDKDRMVGWRACYDASH